VTRVLEGYSIETGFGRDRARIFMKWSDGSLTETTCPVDDLPAEREALEVLAKAARMVSPVNDN